MRKLALILSTFGFIAFAGMARADQKTENSEKTDTTTTLGGKQKTTKTKRVERADGATTETKVETTRPKADDKRDNDAKAVRHDEPARGDAVRSDATRSDATRSDVSPKSGEATVKTDEHTTITGKKERKTTKKVDNADGSHTETTTTTTEPNRK